MPNKRQMKRNGRTVAFVVCYLQLSMYVRPALSVTEEQLKVLRYEFTKLQEEHVAIQTECEDLKRVNSKLWMEVNRLSYEVKEIQQHVRIDNVEITGVPQRPNENIYDVIMKIAKVIQVPYSRNDISEAHRLAKGKLCHPSIVVRFISRRVRDLWLNSSKAKTCSVQQLFPDVNPGPFFINQHLTTFKKGLLDMAKRMVLDGSYAFAWAKDGKVYVRKRPASDIIRIRTYDDLENYRDPLKSKLKVNSDNNTSLEIELS